MKRIFFNALFFIAVTAVFAQTSSQPADGVYLIPQTIYVGDHGRLVLPLGAAYSEIEPAVITGKHLLPSTDNIVITRLEIEKKSGVRRLLVDFQAYAPGTLAFPVIKIGGHQFTGLNVRISSILETQGEGDMVLSEAALPLAVPGTVFIVYGSIIGIVLLLFFSVFFGLWGLPHMRSSRVWRYRKLALRSLQRTLHRSRNSIIKNGLAPGEEHIVLSRLSQEFRKFLRFFTGLNCQTMVPGEFLLIPKMMKSSEERGGGIYIKDHPDILYSVFKQIDDLRFSGMPWGAEDVLSMIDEIKQFTDAFESIEKDRDRREGGNISGSAPAKGAAV